MTRYLLSHIITINKHLNLYMITRSQKLEFHQIGADNNSNLINAVGRNDFEAVKYLVTTDFGHSFKNVTSRAKQSAFNYAASEGHLHIVKYLLRKEFRKSIDLKFNANEALQQAISNNHLEVVKYLLETLETKKHINVNENIVNYCSLAPLETLQYLIFDYKMDISKHVNDFMNNSHFITKKPYAIKLFQYYQLEKEIGGDLNVNTKEKKIKI
jgi:ankyrin repeat protein